MKNIANVISELNINKSRRKQNICWDFPHKNNSSIYVCISFFSKHSLFNKSEETPLINHRKMYLQAFSLARQLFHLTEKIKSIFSPLKQLCAFSKSKGGWWEALPCESRFLLLSPGQIWWIPLIWTSQTPQSALFQCCKNTSKAGWGCRGRSSLC